MNFLSKQKLIEATVVDIRWERINLFLYIKVDFSEGADKETPLDFYAVNGKFVARIKFNIESISEDGIYCISTSIINPGYNRCLPRGLYNICICQGENEMAIVMSDEAIVPKMPDMSRAFLYGTMGSVYNVVFFVNEEVDGLNFAMYTMASNGCGTGPAADELEAQEWTAKTDAEKKYDKTMAKRRKIFRGFWTWLYNFLLKFNPADKKTILFFSEQNEAISTNQKAVYDRMVARGLDKEYEIMFSFRSIVSKNYSKKSWFNMIKKLAKANIIIMDDHAPIMDWMNLRKSTKVLMIWHAGAGFKSSGYSRWGNKGAPAPYNCHRQYNYGIAGSKKIAHFFAEVWGINTEQVLPTGMPRMDEYNDPAHKEATKEKIYKDYPMLKGKEVILFAPTYRGVNRAEACYPYELIDFDALYELCGDRYVVLFKMHPWVPDAVPIKPEHADKFLDFNKFPNINDLFYVTDLLITDYSSSIFEFSLMNKPMLFFAYDEIQYSFSRGFHRDYRESAPGKVVRTFAELLEAIRTEDYEFEKVQKYVEDQFDYIDSGASDRVIDWLILDKMPDEFRNAIDAKLEEQRKMAEMVFATPEQIEAAKSAEKN